MNQEMKIADCYPHLDLLLNELSIASTLLCHHHRKGRADNWQNSLNGMIFLEMIKFVNAKYFDRTQEMGRIVSFLYEKRQDLLSRSDKKLVKLITLDVGDAVDEVVIEKLQLIAHHIQMIDILFKNSDMIRELIGNAELISIQQDFQIMEALFGNSDVAEALIDDAELTNILQFSKIKLQ